MDKHWDDLMDLSECIFRKLVHFDKDGIDADFLCTGKKIRDCKNVDKFRDELAQQTPKRQKVSEVPIGVADVLTNHFNNYRNRLDRSIALGGNLPAPKGVTLLVLTNGLWVRNDDQNDYVEKAIIGFVKELEKDRRGTVRKRGFSIQFVQFGDDSDAAALFQKLDDEIVSQSGEDIVDCEPWNGIFHKIILGSIIKMFDELSHTGPRLLRAE